MPHRIVSQRRQIDRSPPPTCNIDDHQQHMNTPDTLYTAKYTPDKPLGEFASSSISGGGAPAVTLKSHISTLEIQSSCPSWYVISL